MFYEFDLKSLPSFVRLGKALKELSSSQCLEENPSIQKKIRDATELCTLMGNEFPYILKDLENIKQRLEEVQNDNL